MHALLLSQGHQGTKPQGHQYSNTQPKKSNRLASTRAHGRSCTATLVRSHAHQEHSYSPTIIPSASATSADACTHHCHASATRLPASPWLRGPFLSTLHLAPLNPHPGTLTMLCTVHSKSRWPTFPKPIPTCVREAHSCLCAARGPTRAALAQHAYSIGIAHTPLTPCKMTRLCRRSSGRCRSPTGYSIRRTPAHPHPTS